MIYVTGDMHGDLSRMYALIASERIKEGDTLIVCGDFGFIWYDSGNKMKREEKELDTLSADIPFQLLFVDGNHENFNKIYRYPEVERFGSRVHQIRKNIFHLKRGHVYIIEGKTFFTFGGAYSVDRYMRIPNESWWKQEKPVDAEYKIGSDSLKKCGFKVDYILTHTAPTEIIRHIGYSPDPHDAELTGYLEWVMHETDFEKWYFGHFHENKRVLDKFFALYEDIYTVTGQKLKFEL